MSHLLPDLFTFLDWWALGDAVDVAGRLSPFDHYSGTLGLLVLPGRVRGAPTPEP